MTGENSPHDQDVVLGIDFGGTKIAVATATTDGTILRQARIATNPRGGAAQALDRAIAVARHVIEETGKVNAGELRSAAAVSPGVVYPDRIALAPNVPGWERIALRDRLRQGLPVARVAVGTDVKAAALAEYRWGALAGADPGVFLNLGTGVAAGIVVGGRVLLGAHGASGEIGYNVRDVVTPPKEVGRRAPLEEYVGGRFLGERASALLGVPTSAQQAFTSSDDGVRDLVDQALDELGAHVANLAVLIDPSRIALGGGLMRSAPRILPIISKWLHRAVPFPPELVKARFLDDAALRGALVLAGDAAADRDLAQPYILGENASGWRTGS